MPRRSITRRPVIIRGLDSYRCSQFRESITRMPSGLRTCFMPSRDEIILAFVAAWTIALPRHRTSSNAPGTRSGRSCQLDWTISISTPNCLHRRRASATMLALASEAVTLKPLRARARASAPMPHALSSTRAPGGRVSRIPARRSLLPGDVAPTGPLPSMTSSGKSHS